MAKIIFEIALIDQSIDVLESALSPSNTLFFCAFVFLFCFSVS